MTTELIHPVFAGRRRCRLGCVVPLQLSSRQGQAVDVLHFEVDGWEPLVRLVRRGQPVDRGLKDTDTKVPYTDGLDLE